MNVIFAGCTSSYGHSFAAVNTKTYLMALGLTKCGAQCAIYDGLLGFLHEESYIQDGIEIVTPKRKGSVIVGELKNIPHFYNFMKKRAKGHEHNILIVELPLFHNFLSYVYCGRKLGYKIVVIAHEWAPTLVFTNVYAKLSSFLYTKTFGYLVDGALPISEYIIRKMAHFNKPYLKVPALADFSKKPIDKDKRKGGYFVYCANANYYRIARLIIDAFRIYKMKGGKYSLVLILSGSETAIDNIKDTVKGFGLFSEVSFFSKLPYDTLLKYYQNASALMIPLDPEYEQDIARFPQKIAEYCSTSVPIITTNVGEVEFYFTDKTCLKSKFSAESFAENMVWIEQHKKEALQIGEESYGLGLNKFEYSKSCEDIFAFLKSLYL
jgi:hypothetical protein